MQVNTTLLKNWLKKQKETNPKVRIDLASKANISSSYLEKIICGNRVPGPNTRFMLAHITGLNEDELFTSLNENGDKAA